MGDFTPELIFVKSVEDTYNDYTYVTLNIYTYSDGECKKISFKNKDEYQLQTSLQHTYDPYILFKSSDGKDLYLFTQRRMTSNVCRFFKFTTDNCEENEIDFKMIMEQTKTEIPNISGQVQQGEQLHVRTVRGTGSNIQFTPQTKPFADISSLRLKVYSPPDTLKFGDRKTAIGNQQYGHTALSCWHV